MVPGTVQWSEDLSGPTDASFAAALPDVEIGTLLDARVLIEPSRGEPWIGRVASYSEDEGIVYLRCSGAQCDLSRFVVGPLLYVDDDISEWEVSAGRIVNKDLKPEVSGGRLLAHALSSVTYPAGALARWFRRIPETDSSRVTFSWYRGSTTWRLRLWSGTYGPQADGDEWLSGSLNLEWEQAAGTGSTSGSNTVDISNTHDWLMFEVATPNGGTPGSDYTNYFEDITVYGAGLTTVNQATVLEDIVGRVESWAIADWDRMSGFCDCDTTTISRLVFDASATASDVVAAVKMDRDVSVRARGVAGSHEPVFVVEQTPTEVSYEATVGPGVQARLASDGILATADSVRVIYRDARDGSNAYVDVTDTAEDSYLVKIGHGKTDVITFETSSSSEAQVVGEAYLERRKRVPIAGSVRIEAPILDADGAEVTPWEIRAGRLMRVKGPRIGNAVGRITQVRKSEDGAEVTLDSQAAGLAETIAR